MRYYLPLLAVIMLMYSLCLEAQTDVTIRKKDFKNDKTGFEQAWKHVFDGNAYYNEQGVWYSSAYDEYKKALLYNNSNPELNYKTGVSALFSDKKDQASDYLLKALKTKEDVADDILLLTGRALQYSGKFSEAIEKLNGYLNFPGKKSDKNLALAKKCIEECNSALIVTKDTLQIEIRNSGSNINSNADDYSELFSADGETVYFATRRQLSKSSNYYSDAKFDENIFISSQNNGKWELAVPAGKNLTTRYCETPLYLSKTNDELYVYTGYNGNGDIKVASKKNGIWKQPESVPFGINSSRAETSFTFSPSGNEIYFVSEGRKDGVGGKDIYFIKKISDRKWSDPQNAGQAINSVFDEESVRFSKLGDTLWFSSKGHNSIGGFDVFYSKKNQAGEWETPVNAGYPVNTPWDELFYNPSPVNDSVFYFVSNRSGGFGGLDIYWGRFLPPPAPIISFVPMAPPKPDTVIIRDTVVLVKEIVPVIQPETPKELVLYLTGKVKDSETGEPIMAKVDIIDLSTDQLINTTASSDVDGSYRVRLPAKKSYMIDLRSSGFLSDMKRINIPVSYSQDVYNLDITLIKVKVGKKVVLNNILFETGKSILTSSSFVELDRLLQILQDNPLMKIEISGHTDKTGTDPLNFKLSGDRARAVVEYLVQKGVDRSRLEFKGYGSLQPIADNATAAGRTKNRRVEFKILEF